MERRARVKIRLGLVGLYDLRFADGDVCAYYRRPQYILRLNNFKIFDITWPNSDTDYVYFTVRVGNQTFGLTHVGLGDLHQRVFYLNWEVGPVFISDNTKIAISYQIVNNGTVDKQKQLAIDAQIAGTVGDVLSAGGDIVDIFVPGAGPCSRCYRGTGKASGRRDADGQRFH